MAWIPGGSILACSTGTGALLGNPYHYRDSRTDGMMEAAFQRVPKAEIFAQTGIQFMQLNTLYQLLAWWCRILRSWPRRKPS